MPPAVPVAPISRPATTSPVQKKWFRIDAPGRNAITAVEIACPAGMAPYNANEMIAQTRPRLRAVEIKRLHHRGRWYFHFHDQLSLAGSDLLVPIELAPALALFDGEHDLAMIRARAPITAQCPADEAATSFVSVAAGSFVRQ